MLTKTDENAAVEREPLDTRVPPHVRIINGALQDDPSSPGKIILQGRLDNSTLRFLQVDYEYQRPKSDRKDIYDALRSGGRLPAIEIGFRGEDFECAGNNFILRPKTGATAVPAYIIDGQQRVTTATRLLEQIPTHPVILLCTVHFDTKREWERDRFTELNKNIRKISPNHHLANLRYRNDAILTLYGLSHNTKDCPLYKKVSWEQNMKRGELVTATVFAQAALQLHSYVSGSGAKDMGAGLSAAAEGAGLSTFRRNVLIFWQIVDECWGVRRIEYRTTATQLKRTFIIQVARLFSSHLDFWDDGGCKLTVTAPLRHKLARFPIADPTIKGLAGSGGAAKTMLYNMIVEHMNSGKRRENYLRSRYARAG